MKRLLSDILALEGTLYVPERRLVYQIHRDRTIDIYHIGKDGYTRGTPDEPTRYKITKLEKIKGEPRL